MVFHEVRDAIEAESAIQFGYKKPDGSIEGRRVSPWQADEESFIGYDHARDEPRRFRYDRVFVPAPPDLVGAIEPNPDDEYVRPS